MKTSSMPDNMKTRMYDGFEGPIHELWLTFRRNPESHERWAGPQLLMQLPEINIFCTGMGSAGERHTNRYHSNWQLTVHPIH